jgi:argininosuccinate lyase
MTNTMWGGRFAASPAEVMEEINASIDFDKRLWRHDILASKAHVAMLAATGILKAKEADEIARGLGQVMAEIEGGTFTFSRALEDIHLNIESRLRELIGPVAGKLHTARSRNDQVATDFRLYLRDELGAIDRALGQLQLALADKALQYAAAVMPGYTHLQTAQPITFGHHCLAYVEMLSRDRGRFADAAKRLSECPLGSAALAGTGFPIDRDMTAKALGFAQPTANSLDAVSDRDFALEILAGASIAAMHLSRLAEEIVIWTSPQFGLARLSDKFTTGSSIMPQKRNPDVFELMRGRSAVAQAALNEVLGITQKLTSGYHRDLQLIKAPLFRGIDSCLQTLEILPSALGGVRFLPENIRLDPAIHAAADANALVARDGIPFREAYRQVAAKFKDKE